MKRCKDAVQKVSSWKYLTNTCSTSFPGAPSASFLLSALNSLQNVSKVNSCSCTGFSHQRDRWQIPWASTNLLLTSSKTKSLSLLCLWLWLHLDNKSHFFFFFQGQCKFLIYFHIFYFSIFVLFFFFLFYFLALQYCIGFAIYQNESATGIHVFPILNPPPSQDYYTQCPWLHSRSLSTHASTGDSRTFTDNSGSVSCGVIAPFSWVLVGTRFCGALQESVSLVLWKFCNQTPLAFRVKSLGDLSPFAGPPGWENGRGP